MQQRLQQEIQRVAKRYRRLFTGVTLAGVWLTTAAVGAALLAWGPWPVMASPWPLVALSTVAVLLTWLAWRTIRRRTRQPLWVAHKIEAKHRELNSLLVTAVEQDLEPGTPRLGFLQTQVVRDALRHAHRTDWRRDVPLSRVLASQLVGLAALTLMLLVISSLGTRVAEARRSGFQDRSPQPPQEKLDFDLTVSPGDTEIERGTSLVITARFPSARPDEATLLLQEANGETQQLPMSLSLSDPVFGVRVADVQQDLSYSILYEDNSTRAYRVTVYEYPGLVRADAELEFPAYTNLPPKRVEDTRRVTAVEGTQLTLICSLNKPVATAQLIGESGETLDLSASAEDPSAYRLQHLMIASGRYRLILTDAEGRQNKEPPRITLNVTPNQRPEVKVVRPARDMRVSPIEELETQASLWDDYGLRRYGINFTLAGQEPADLTLGESTSANQRLQVDHLISFEELKAEPDQLLTYYYWAEDIGPDNQPRRTMGDLYFAEVRHFEEIFREAEQPAGGQEEQQQQQQQQGGQNAQQAEQLAELQKQIINATWTIIRRETGANVTMEFTPDMQEVQTAQATAIEQLEQLKENLEDAESLRYADAVEQHMLRAIRELTTAGDTSSPAILPQALSSEQAAYQALLKLRAREFNVTRSRQPSQQQQQPSGSASGPQSRSQQQLEQLQLDSSENRYETERQAETPQEQQQRETLQVLNRLRDLARRQEDLNRRLKELQSALEAAETEQEREEILAQLKRLREQEQQMLQDTDELGERMERPENQERMAESREQLDQTRENIRQATESLREGQVSRAVASGTRAQEQLDSMREEFRQQASNRFEDEMQQLREDARELDQQQQELSDQLQNQNQVADQQPGLRRPDSSEDLRDAFRQQRDQLEQLLDDMQDTVERSEESEPLMAGRLYDAIRDTRQQRVDDALDATAELLDRGFMDEARVAEEQATEGVQNLREAVDEAAEGILANEEEALRRAQQTLDRLASELDREMRRARNPGDEQPSETEPQEGQPNREGQPGGNQSRQSSNDQQNTDQQPNEQPPRGTQPGQQAGGQQPSSQQANDQSPNDQPRDGQQPNDQQTPPSPPSPNEGQQQPGMRPQQNGQPNRDGGNQSARGPSEMERMRGPSGPITGDFLPWSDQLRDVEEMLSDPELRSDVARVREAARDIRREMNRNFQGPNWDLVQDMVAEPLNELRDRVADELRRHGSEDALVPIDRDPVPQKFVEQVRRYYERLGSGE